MVGNRPINAFSAEVAIACNGLLRVEKGVEGRELAGATGLGLAASCVTGRQTALGESPANRKGENSRINTGNLWWAWVDLPLSG